MVLLATTCLTTLSGRHGGHRRLSTGWRQGPSPMPRTLHSRRRPVGAGRNPRLCFVDDHVRVNLMVVDGR